MRKSLMTRTGLPCLPVSGQFRVARFFLRLLQSWFLLVPASVLVLSLGWVLSLSAIAAPPALPVTNRSEIEVAGDAGNQSAQLPAPLANKLRQDLSQRTGIPAKTLQIVAATRKTWSDGCLGLAQPGELCTMAMVDGWHVTLSAGSRRWVYRTDTRGMSIRLEKNG